MSLDISMIRDQFPALAVETSPPRIFLDNPAGTQVCLPVLDRMRACLVDANANLGGDFVTSVRAQAVVDEARQAAADFLGATPKEIVFGANMTTLTLQMARSLGRALTPGDEIILSRMDHDANVEPWRLMAEEREIIVKWLDFNPETYEFDPNDLDALLTDRTRLLAVGYASNVLGTINPVKALVEKARAANALTYVDAVHYAPHGPIDVAALGCDFLVCSAYKFYGPHVGLLYGRAGRLAELFAYKVRPAPSKGPERFETGTQNHEGLAGVHGAIEYLAGLSDASDLDRPKRIRHAMEHVFEHEAVLGWRLIEGLSAMPGVKIHGITDRSRAAFRAPTVSFTAKSVSPSELARRLTEAQIFAWAGHSYAIEPIGRLGLLESGGVLRLGIAHYNTEAEIDRTLEVIEASL